MSTPETTIPDGGPAFPSGPLGDTMHGEDGRTWHQFPATSGMSLRDAFALAALPALVTEALRLNHESWDATAGHAYIIADAMLERRLK